MRNYLRLGGFIVFVIYLSHLSLEQHVSDFELFILVCIALD